VTADFHLTAMAHAVDVACRLSDSLLFIFLISNYLWWGRPIWWGYWSL